MPYYENALNTLQLLRNAAEDLEKKVVELEAIVSVQMLSMQSAINAPGTPAWITLANARAIREKHREWERKIHGVLMGYTREMQSAHKNFSKGRMVGFTSADVTVGTDEDFAKAIQHKHTVSAENSAVNEMIAKAANQLTGESGEKPLASQRKIIDMMINDPQNWWPFDLKDFSDLDPSVMLEAGVIPLALLKLKGEKQILAQLQKHKRAKKGLDRATINSLANHVGGPTNSFMVKNPAKPQSTALYHPNGQRAEVLTIKITYGQRRKFTTGSNSSEEVGKIVFVAYLEHSQLKVAYMQHS